MYCMSRISVFRYELWKSRVDLIKLSSITKFYQNHKQQNERNCWREISAARHTLQSLFLARDEGKVADPCFNARQRDDWNLSIPPGH